MFIMCVFILGSCYCHSLLAHPSAVNISGQSMNWSRTPRWSDVRCTLERLEVQIPDLSAAEENASDKTRRKQAKDRNSFRGFTFHQDKRKHNTLTHTSTHKQTRNTVALRHTSVYSLTGISFSFSPLKETMAFNALRHYVSCKRVVLVKREARRSLLAHSVGHRACT